MRPKPLCKYIQQNTPCPFKSSCHFAHPLPTVLVDPPPWIFTSCSELPGLKEFTYDEMRAYHYNSINTGTLSEYMVGYDRVWMENYKLFRDELDVLGECNDLESVSERAVDCREDYSVFVKPMHSENVYKMLDDEKSRVCDKSVIGGEEMTIEDGRVGEVRPMVERKRPSYAGGRSETHRREYVRQDTSNVRDNVMNVRDNVRRDANDNVRHDDRYRTSVDRTSIDRTSVDRPVHDRLLNERPVVDRPGQRPFQSRQYERDFSQTNDYNRRESYNRKDDNYYRREDNKHEKRFDKFNDKNNYIQRTSNVNGRTQHREVTYDKFGNVIQGGGERNYINRSSNRDFTTNRPYNRDFNVSRPRYSDSTNRSANDLRNVTRNNNSTQSLDAFYDSEDKKDVGEKKRDGGSDYTFGNVPYGFKK